MNVRLLTDGELAFIDARLPLNRLDQYRQGNSSYLIAWDGETPVGHAHLAWPQPDLKDPAVPELQDVYVLPERRRQGVATALTEAAERETATRGYDRLMLSVGVENEAAKLLYERAGFRHAGFEPERVKGTIVLRGNPVAVDDTLVYLVKRL